MMRARTLGTIQRLSGHASDQAPYRVLKVAPPHGAPICHRCGLFRGYTPDLGEASFGRMDVGRWFLGLLSLVFGTWLWSCLFAT